MYTLPIKLTVQLSVGAVGAVGGIRDVPSLWIVVRRYSDRSRFVWRLWSRK